MDFLNDCRIAAQFCMLLSRPPWLIAFWLIRPNMPLRHGLSGVPAFASIAYGNGCAAPPIPRRCIQNAAKPPIHGLFIDGQGSGEKLRASD
ncbi:MAG: hypothetical protein II516_03305, partial [Treponema sp.]|nr:hypothetical protein [Treponema sp.]